MHIPPRWNPSPHTRQAASGDAQDKGPRPSPGGIGRDLVVIVGVAGVYFIAGKLGLRLALIHPGVTAVWPPTGFALAACLVLGYRVWPGILLGALLVNVTTAGSVATSLGIACGNTLEALLGTFLVNRCAHGRAVFERAHDIFTFVALAALLSTLIGATVGVTSLALGGFAPWPDYLPIWITWWLGNAMGALIFTPFFLSWSHNPRWSWPPRQAGELLLIWLTICLVGLMVFADFLPHGLRHQPLGFVCLPLLIWAAFRFGQREATTAVVILAVIATGGTFAGFGPFAGETPEVSSLLLQMFLGTMAVTTTVLAAAVAERQRAQGALHRSERELADFLDNAVVGFHSAGPDGRILRVNQAELDLLGYNREAYVGHHIAEFYADPEVGHDLLQRLSDGQTLHNYEARLRCQDGSVKDVLIDANALWEDGRFVHTRCFTRDITERKRVEAQLQASLHEKEVLLKEIHHRVKNNLQIISSLLDLQAESVPDPQVRAVFTESQHHIQAMALLHESLYQSQNLAYLDAADYLRRLSQRLFEAYHPPDGRISLTLALETVALEPNRAISCGLLLNELLSNCLKHAFPHGQAGEVHIALRACQEQVTLSVRDTGVGLPEGLDFRHTDSLGLQLVYLLTEQLGGTITLERTGGTTFTLILPFDPAQGRGEHRGQSAGPDC
ncbi:MAG TPA: MASE1 domain-containing protein [Candidatus Tectomicrobia bacterium]|nr:MASE1 domain-containing protein [Candidatus Tectomicrobia bacterium]